MTAIAFQISDACGGLAHCHGLLRDDGESLVVEHQTQDGIVGIVKTEVQELRIPLKEIGSIALEETWFGWSSKLVIQLTSMKHLASIPGMKHGRLILPIARSERPAAAALVQSVSACLNKGEGANPTNVYST
jgi:hypothetical protein